MFDCVDDTVLVKKVIISVSDVRILWPAVNGYLKPYLSLYL